MDCTFLFSTGYYQCQCPRLFNGFQCETFDEHFSGGIGGPVTPAPTTPMSIDMQKAECIRNKCNEKAGNGRCDVSKFTLNFTIYFQIRSVISYV